MDFSKRAEQKEIMDLEDVGLAKMRSTFDDINRTNSLLGGHRITRRAVAMLIRNNSNSSISILDVGCGDGASLRHLASYLRIKGIAAQLYGLDLSEDAIKLANLASTKHPEITYFKGNILSANDEIPTCDIVISTLTMHHFNNQEIPEFLSKCAQLSKKALVINDLHRNRLAYYLFKIFSAIFIRSSIAKKDGLVSIRNGFRKKELKALSENYLDWNHIIRWKWAFRYVWIIQRNRLTDP